MKSSITQFLTFLFLSILHAQLLAEPLGTPDIDDIEYPDDEEHSPQEVELGKILFYDNRLSANNNQSCATCHNPDLGFGDGMAFSLGTSGNKLERHTPHLYNLAWNITFLWDGRSNSLEDQALGPIQSKDEMGLDLATLVERLNKVPLYQASFKDVYGEDNAINPENVARAIAAFERSIISNNAPFDRYLAGDNNAMSPEAVRGLELFKGKAKCIECHDGANFTDNSFHNIGLADEDIGRQAIIEDTSLAKAFKTPGLRNILLTAPYMHDGSLDTLEDVINFYNKGGARSAKNTTPNNLSITPLNLNKQETIDLIAFLGALTDPVTIERPMIP